MSTHRNHNPSTAQDAGVPPAPSEAHQRAGVEIDFSTILNEALTVPGVVNQAYRAFRNYSVGNQLLAAVQLMERGLSLSPIASFNDWKSKGRYVQKGQKALRLWMPVTMRKHGDDSSDEVFHRFILKAAWFSLEQTEGDEFIPELTIPSWDASLALSKLDVEEVPFDSLRGNVMGFARGREIAINPMNPLKHKTRFHELAHVVLGHTTEDDMVDEESLSNQIEEVEAESVAYIICSLLDLPGQAESRNYIQGWLDGHQLPERSAKRIFGAADKIMKAGQVCDTETDARR